MMYLKKISYLLVATALLFSCKKKDEDPTAPVLEFKEISSSQVEQFNNTVRITIGFEDHQGDLGETDPDILTLRVKDSRLADFDWYHVPPMTPDNQELHIKGTYSIELDPLFLMGNGSQEQTSFSIEIRDRAGNWSNTIRTPNVLIVDSL
ncbi:MAG: hypothetical protein K1X54_02590 [Flavobacteriales bacterium]|nr:hypothetical protein [Flavobacteriales bacterium]